jgi:hypothetical protein
VTTTLTKMQLLTALFTRGPARITIPGKGATTTGILMAVERESGSGNSFNLTLLDEGTSALRKVHVYTVD